MNRVHAQAVVDIEEIMLGLIEAPPVRLSDDDLRNILRRRIRSDADAILGDVMQAYGYRDWYQRLSHIDVTAARNDWSSLTYDGKHLRLKWFAGQVQKWPR